MPSFNHCTAYTALSKSEFKSEIPGFQIKVYRSREISYQEHTTWTVKFALHFITVADRFLQRILLTKPLRPALICAIPVRPVVPGCAGCAMAHPDFGRSVNPISTRGGTDSQCQIELLFFPLHYFHSFRDGLGVKKSNFFFYK